MVDDFRTHCYEYPAPPLPLPHPHPHPPRACGLNYLGVPLPYLGQGALAVWCLPCDGTVKDPAGTLVRAAGASSLRKDQRCPVVRAHSVEC